MKVLGLIVEYNPFHNGHLYHLEQSVKASNADYVVCVMSGNFIQRGEPALVNKWARAKMALLSGVDLVLELPVVYASASAEYFAFGAVKILDSLGMIDYLCFGSEHGLLENLIKIADVLHDEPSQYKIFLKEKLALGLSYPTSRTQALKAYFSLHEKDFFDDVESIIGSPNNILGIEYLKSLKKLKSQITPLTIKRTANSYNSEDLTGSISSATSIRKYIKESLDPLLSSTLPQVLPQGSLGVLREEFKNGRGPVDLTNFENILLALLRKSSTKELKELPYISEGLENKFKQASRDSGSLEQLIQQIKSKRYTRTRIQRSLISLLTGITQKEFEAFNQFERPQYIKILGFNEKGRVLLSKMKKSCSLPVITKPADFKRSCNELLGKMLEIEANSTDIYVLGYQNGVYKKAGLEYTQSPVIIKQP